MPGTAAATEGFIGELTLVSKFGGVSGAANGQFANPDDLAVDQAGNIYIPDGSNHRVQVFNASGTYLRKFGEQGSSPASCSIPNAVAVDANGNAYVADRGNARVMMFNSAGSFVKGWGWGVDNGGNTFQTCTTATTLQHRDVGHTQQPRNAWRVLQPPGDRRQRQRRRLRVRGRRRPAGSGVPDAQQRKTSATSPAGARSARPAPSPTRSPRRSAWRSTRRVQRLRRRVPPDGPRPEVHLYGRVLRMFGSIGNGNGQLIGAEDVAVDRTDRSGSPKAPTKGSLSSPPTGSSSTATPPTGPETARSPRRRSSSARRATSTCSTTPTAGSSFSVLRLRESIRPDVRYGVRLFWLDEVEGKVFVEVRSGSAWASCSAAQHAGFVPLTEAETVPVRSILDTTRGTVKLTTARNKAGKPQSGEFSGGVFQVLPVAQEEAPRAWPSCDSRTCSGCFGFKLTVRAVRAARSAA